MKKLKKNIKFKLIHPILLKIFFHLVAVKNAYTNKTKEIFSLAIK